MQAKSWPQVDPAQVKKRVLANRIVYLCGVVNGFRHVSVCHHEDAGHRRGLKLRTFAALKVF